MQKGVEIVPSILSADFTVLAEEIKRLEGAGCRRIQLDVMDGSFVPNISFGQPVVAAIRKCTGMHLEVQLMIERPERYIEDFSKAGADSLFIHREACRDYIKTIREIKALGMEAGIAINPKTPVDDIADCLHEADMALVMTVEPGFGGQRFIKGIERKVSGLRGLMSREGVDIPIEVDGGINTETAPLAVRAGARRLVAGSFVFAGGPEKNIKALYRCASEEACA